MHIYNFKDNYFNVESCEISISNFTFSHRPQKKSQSDYEKVRQWFIEQLESNSEVCSLIEYGTINSPGISDIDFILIIKNQLLSQKFKSVLNFKNVPRFVTDIMCDGDLKIMARYHFKDIAILGAIKYQVLLGEKIKINSVPSPIEKLIRIVQVMDWLNERTLLLMYYEHIKVIPIPRVLGALYSFFYSIILARKMLPNSLPNVAEFEMDLVALRKNWFQQNEDRNLTQLVQLLYKGINLGFTCLLEVNKFICQNQLYSFDNWEPVFFPISERKGFYFTSNWNDINPKFSYSLQNKKILWIATPMAWAVHYGFYSQFDGYISRIIKNNLSFCIKYRDYIDRELREILTRRIHLCNEMMRFLQDKGLKHGLYRFAHIKKSPL